jgi:transmembrane sensor
MKIDPKNIDQNLLVMYLLDELSSENRALVEDWINGSDENSSQFKELETTWLETGKIDPVPVVVDVDLAWNNLKSRIRAEVSVPELKTEPKVKVRKLKSYWWIVAAAALVILSTFTVVFSDWFKKSMNVNPVLIESFADVIQDTLNDGTIVTLNQGSKIAFVESVKKSERQVNLEGEAFFAVKPDTSRPFVINAGIGAIRVLGTEFNVKAYQGSDLEVFVESGLVQLAITDSLGTITESILLEAGEKGIISYASGRILKSGDQPPDELYWANRKLIFRDAELSKVFEVLSQYYDFEVKTEHAGILSCQLSASFTNTELPQIMEVIAISFQLELQSEDSTYSFNGKGCLDEEVN